MDENTEMINFNLEDFMKFKIAYRKAEKEQKKDFKFKDKDFHTGYGKYLISYLETKFKNIKP